MSLNIKIDCPGEILQKQKIAENVRLQLQEKWN